MEKINNVLKSVIRGLENPETQIRVKLVNEWRGICGEKLYKITKPRLTKKGILYVLVGDGAYAFEIRQRYQQTLLKRAQEAFGSEVIKDLRVIVGD